MKKILILTVAIGILPGAVLAQQSGSELLRAELEQARQSKDEAMDDIALEAELIRSTISASRPAPLAANKRPALKPLLHPSFLSLPGRMVMTVLAPAPALPILPDVPFTPPKPVVTIELSLDQLDPATVDLEPSI